MSYQACIAFTKENPTVILDINKIINDKTICQGTCILNTNIEENNNLTDKQKQYLKEHLYINGMQYQKYIDGRIIESTYRLYGDSERTDKSAKPFQFRIEPIERYEGDIEVEISPRYVWTLYIDEFDNELEFQFDITIKFIEDAEDEYIVDNGKILYTYQILACHVNTTDYIEDYTNIGVNNSSKNSAFMLLRTNPKLTGNIKLVVTDNGMYLDTFKHDTNHLLNQSQYRKQPVSKNSNYGQDVFSVFKNVSSDILMDVNSILYNTTYSLDSAADQYATQYEYGAETNDDKLYSEKFKLLAPLHLGNNLPSYFVIFKTPHNPNIQKFFNNETANADYLNEVISTSEICKVFDLREHTFIGQYLQNWNNKFVEAGMNNICYTDFDLITSVRQIKNITKSYADIWQGIAYKTGGFIAQKELSRFQYLLGQTQEKINLYYLDGFKKCELLYPGIINLEFMFNDNDAEDFKVYHYFGLYVTENQFQEITNVITPGLSDTQDTIYYYNNTNSTKDDTLKEQIKNCVESKHLLSVATAESVKVFNNSSDNIDISFKQFLNDDVALHPGTCVANNAETKLIQLDEFKSFMTMTFTNVIEAGEHFRFIHTTKNDKIIVLELIASSDQRLARFSNPIAPYVLTNNFIGKNRIIKEIQSAIPDLSGNLSDKTQDAPAADIDNTKDNAVLYDDIDIEFYTINFYAGSINGNQVTLKEQFERIEKAIAKFNSHLMVYSYNNTAISFVSTRSNILMQHILKYNYARYYDYVHFFNAAHITEVYNVHDGQVPLENVTENGNKLYFYEFNNPYYDTTEERSSSIVKFLNTNILRQYDVYEVNADLQSIVESVKIPLCYAADKQYKALTGINIVENLDTLSLQNEVLNENITDYSVYTLLSPYNLDKALIYLNYKPMLVGNKIKIYDQRHAYVSFLSLLSVKDFNFKLDEITNKAVKPYEQHISFNQTTIVDFKHYDVLKKFVLYEIVEGNINDLNLPLGTKFILLADGYIVYKDKKIEYTPYNNIRVLTVLKGTKLKIHELVPERFVSKNGNCNMQSINLLSSANNKLIAPICPPLNMSWSTTGEYFDHTNIVNAKETNGFNQNNITGYFYEAGLEFPKLSKIIGSTEEGDLTIKDYILKTGRIKKFYLNLPTCIGHYNADSDVLEFIYNGILFTININNTQLNGLLFNMSMYNNCEIAVLNDYNPALDNEIYISDTEQYILFVNHTYKGNSAKISCNYVKHIDNKTNILTYASYYWHTAPYAYEFINAMYNEVEQFFYLHKTNDYVIEDKSAYTFVQPGYTVYGHMTNYTNEEGVYAYFDIEHDLTRRNDANRQFSAIAAPIYLADFYRHDLLYPTQYDESLTYQEDEKILLKINNNKIKYSTQPIVNTAFYDYFLKSQKYNGKNLDELLSGNITTDEYLNVQYVVEDTANDITMDFEVVQKRDNRLYMPYILYNMRRQVEFFDFDKMVLWAKSILENRLTLHIINYNESQDVDLDAENVMNIISLAGPTKDSKYCPGFIKPEFIDMFTFDVDHTLEKSINSDLSLSNTSLSSINNISMYPYRTLNNKINKKMSYGFIQKNIVTPVKLQTTLINKLKSKSAEKFENITANENKRLGQTINDLNLIDKSITPHYNQYNLQMKSFFGSCCMNVPEKAISIQSYNDNMANNIQITSTTLKSGTTAIAKDRNEMVSSLSAKSFKVQINLTNLFLGYFTANKNFMSNWKSKDEATINNFIKNYLLKFYNLNKTVINIYQRTINTNRQYIGAKCTLDKTSQGILDVTYTPVNNLNIKITTDKNHSVIASFEITAVSNIAILPIISILRQ